MTTLQKKALYLFGMYTRQSFVAWDLAGPSNAKIRATILSLLQGAKVPQSKAGISALQAAFYSLAQTHGECSAERQENFTAWARTHVKGEK